MKESHILILENSFLKMLEFLNIFWTEKNQSFEQNRPERMKLKMSSTKKAFSCCFEIKAVNYNYSVLLINFIKYIT